MIGRNNVGSNSAIMAIWKRESPNLWHKLTKIFIGEMIWYPGLKYCRKQQQMWERKKKKDQDGRMLINVESRWSKHGSSLCNSLYFKISQSKQFFKINKHVWSPIFVPEFSGCVIKGKSPNLSGPPCPHLTVPASRLAVRSQEAILVKCVFKYLARSKHSINIHHWFSTDAPTRVLHRNRSQQASQEALNQ